MFIYKHKILFILYTHLAADSTDARPDILKQLGKGITTYIVVHNVMMTE